MNATAEPAPLLYSHMGMLTVLPNASLAAAWQVRVAGTSTSANADGPLLPMYLQAKVMT